MVRLIDEKKLIEEIKKMSISPNTLGGSSEIDKNIFAYDECLVDVLKVINEQPKVGEILRRRESIDD